MLSAFGSSGDAPEDVNADGTVNVNDLLQLLSNFGVTGCGDLDEPAVEAPPRSLQQR